MVGYKIQRRNNIHKYHLHGEANSALLETLSEERNKLREILKDYSLKNIFNADKIGLFFCMASNQILVSTSTSDTKCVSK